jgi:hypothetical protein
MGRSILVGWSAVVFLRSDHHHLYDARSEIELPPGSDDVELYGRVPDTGRMGVNEEQNDEQSSLLQPNHRRRITTSRSIRRV